MYKISTFCNVLSEMFGLNTLKLDLNLYSDTEAILAVCVLFKVEVVKGRLKKA